MFIFKTNVNKYGVYSSQLFLLASGVAYLKHLYVIGITRNYG